MRIRSAAALAAIFGAGACSESTVPDLNNPTVEQYQTVTSASQLQNLATGLVDGDRATHGTQVLFFETIARDIVRFDPAESRYITTLLGTNISNSDFIGNGLFNAPYRTVAGADLLVSGIAGAPAVVATDAQKAATQGFARTIKALQYIRLIESRDTIGVAIQTVPDSTVPIRCKPAVLTYIAALLDSAAANLRTAGNTPLPFSLPSGFNGFTTADAPSGTDFLQFNRALLSRVEMYRGFAPLELAGSPSTAPDAARLQAALTALDASFYNASASRAALDVGIYHNYSTGSGELTNPLYDVGVFRVNPKVITDGAEPGDLRIQAKVDTSSSNTSRTSRSGSRFIGSRYLLRQPSGPNSPIALLRNEELVLNRALILWGLNRDAEARTLVNLIRQSAGLGAAAPGDHQQLLRAILKEKRYSLLAESPARLIDFRMFGILSELGRERPGLGADNTPGTADDTPGLLPAPVFPIPNNEAVARSQQLTCQA